MTAGAQALTPEFTLGELLGPELVASLLGDGVEELLERVLLIDPREGQAGTWSALVAVALDGQRPRLPLLSDAVTLDFATLASGVPVGDDELPIASLTLTLDPFSLVIQLLPGLGLRFSSDLLVPLEGSDAVQLNLGQATALTVDERGTRLDAPTLQLPACGLGRTGIELTGGSITLALFGNNGDARLQALGVDDAFRGVVLEKVGFRLPPGLEEQGAVGTPTSALVFDVATISAAGFSARVEVDFPATARLELLGAEIAPRQLVVEVQRNSIVGGGLTGTLTLPFFGHPADVRVAILDGAWGLSLSGELARLSVPGAFDLELTGLGVERNDGTTWFKVSGSLTPTVEVPGVIAKTEWPTLSLRDVLIDQHGHVKASGGRMALSSQKTMTIGKVIKAKLTHFAFGTDPDGFQAVSLSGEVDLIEGLPMRGTFDELEVRWKAGAAPRFSLAGVQVAVGLPGVFALDGRLTFVTQSAGESAAALSSHGFNGALRLGLPTLGLLLDGQLAIREVSAAGATYTALFLTLDLQLPAGIPLLQTGLAIYGFNGLLAWHFGPNVQAGDWIGWFLGTNPAGARGVTQLAKWRVEEPTRGLGAGITIGTLPDTGFSWNARTTFIILLPGPDLILSGDGSFLSKGKGFDVKGALGVMITYDGNAATLSAAIAAEVGKEPVVRASGAAAAFFDFNDPDAWFLNIGTRQAPLNASILKVFDATAYLELDEHRLVLGARAGLDETWKLGPLTARARAELSGEALVVRRPPRTTGDASLDGLLELSAFGLAVTIGLNALVNYDVLAQTAVLLPAWHVRFEIDAYLRVKVLVKTFTVGGRIEVDLAGGDVAALTPPPLPLAGLSIEHAHSTETWPLELSPARNADGLDAGASPGPPPTSPWPVVPPDGLPTLTFAVPLTDTTPVAQNKPVTADPVRIGNADYTFRLDGITIERLDGQGGSTPFAGPITGKWCEEIAKTRLQLFADTPYFLSRLTHEVGNRLADHQAHRDPPPCASLARPTERRCAPMANARRVAVQPGADAVPPGAAFDGIRLDLGTWRLATTTVVRLVNGDAVAFDEQVVEVDVRVPAAQAGGSMTHLAQVAGSAGDQTPVDPSSLFTVYDAAGAVVPSMVTPGATASTLHIAPQRPATKVELNHTLLVEEVCYLPLAEQQRAEQEERADQDKQSALADPQQTKPAGRTTFAPWSRYRIVVKTAAVRSQDGATFTFEDRGWFQTGGPPGVDSPPAGQPAPPAGAATTADRYPNGGVLGSLDRYLAATVPAAAHPPPAGPLESAYRGDDPAMVFNEGYVPALYAAAGAGLALNVLDQNAQPLITDGQLTQPDGTLLLDASGKTIAAQTAELGVPAHTDRFRTLWQSRLAGCSVAQQYPDDSSLTLALDPRSALAPRRRYELQASAGPGGPIVARAAFRTSRFLTAAHHLQSHPDLVLTATITASAVPASLPDAVDGSSRSTVGSAEAAAFDALWEACGLGTPPERQTLDVTALVDAAGTVRALIVTSPEPLSWDRILWSATRAPMPAGMQAVPPRRAKIADADLSGPAAVDVMLLEDGDPAGIELYVDGAGVYRFAGEGRWPSGTLFRVLSGSSAAPSTPDAQVRACGTAIVLPGVVSLVAGRTELHKRRVLGASSYAPLPLRALRRWDGTAFFLVHIPSPPVLAAFPTGDLCLACTVKREIGDPARRWTRAGDASDEQTRLHLQLP
jgi:hypothetical protein